jgi:hypothetical protein
MSYLNVLWGFAQSPEYADLEMFGAPAPMFQLALHGNTAMVAAQDADASE